MNSFHLAALAAGWIVNPAWETPEVLFAVPQFNGIHPRKRRLKFKRRYVKWKLKEYLQS